MPSPLVNYEYILNRCAQFLSKNRRLFFFLFSIFVLCDLYTRKLCRIFFVPFAIYTSEPTFFCVHKLNCCCYCRVSAAKLHRKANYNILQVCYHGKILDLTSLTWGLKFKLCILTLIITEMRCTRPTKKYRYDICIYQRHRIFNERESWRKQSQLPTSYRFADISGGKLGKKFKFKKINLGLNL